MLNATQNKTTPLMWLHGEDDTTIPIEAGKHSFDKLKAHGVRNSTWKSYPKLDHSIDQRTLTDIGVFLEQVATTASVKSKL